MTELVVRALERIHGHLGWLTVAALAHPAILLRRPGRRARLSAVLATALATVAGVLGGVVYPHYRNTVKQRLFIAAPSIGWLFERKEHLAVAAIAFAWVGALLHLAESSFPTRALRAVARRGALSSFVVASVLSLVVAVIGVIVSVRAPMLRCART